jgi:hypothetical protein
MKKEQLLQDQQDQITKHLMTLAFIKASTEHHVITPLEEMGVTGQTYKIGDKLYEAGSNTVKVADIPRSKAKIELYAILTSDEQHTYLSDSDLTFKELVQERKEGRELYALAPLPANDFLVVPIGAYYNLTRQLPYKFISA